MNVRSENLSGNPFSPLIISPTKIELPIEKSNKKNKKNKNIHLSQVSFE